MTHFISPDTNYDVLIVGGGIIGLASAYYATARGYRTLIIEQYGIGNDVNSSKGIERIFRLMQDNESEARLAETSLALWMGLQYATRTKLLAMDDLIFFGHRDAPMTTEGNVQDIKKTMDRMGMPYAYLGSPRAIHERFPVFKLTGLADDYVGLVQAAAASINVREAAGMFLLAARQTGLLHVLERHAVREVSPRVNAANRHGYTLHIETEGTELTVQGNHLIACPGVWADSVLRGLGLKQAKQWKVWQMSYAYWKVKEQHPKLPIWFEFGNIDASDRGTFYGFPPLDFSLARNNLVKMSADYTYDILDEPPTVRPCVNERLMKELVSHLTELISPNTVDSTEYCHAGTCLYSMAPDGKLVIGRIPVAPTAESFHTSASMCIMDSGRAFKYAPLFGRVLVELAVDGCSPYQHDLEIFSSNRIGLFEAPK